MTFMTIGNINYDVILVNYFFKDFRCDNGTIC